MNRKRTATAFALAALLLVVTTSAVHAGDEENLKTEWLTYVGTNQEVPILGYVAATPCDTAGIGGVRFCETLDEEEEDDLPDRIAIDVRDDLGPRVGFYYRFVNETSGDTLWDGVGCGHVNTLVPHTGQGPPEDPAFDQNATHLDVIPDVRTSLQENDSVIPCGSPTVLSATVVVTWRYNAPVFDP